MTSYMNKQVNTPTSGRGHAPMRLQSLSERTESTLFQRRRQHAQETHDQKGEHEMQENGMHVPPFPVNASMTDRQPLQPGLGFVFFTV